MRRQKPLDVLMLFRHENPSRIHASIRAHIHTLDRAPDRVRVVYANAIRRIPGTIRRMRFDAIVLHNTFLAMRWNNQFSTFTWEHRWVADHPAPKLAMPQDEYDHSELLDQWLAAWGVSVVFTNFDERHRRALLYPLTSKTAQFQRCFTGYIDEDAVSRMTSIGRPLAERGVDIVYRAQNLPYFFGSHGRLKSLVAEIVSPAATQRGLSVDISTRPQDTILGDAWLEFIASSRGVLGVESGSSVLDRRGEIRSAVQRMLAAEPDLTFEEVSVRLPKDWDSYRFFALGPRHFEAVVSRTAQLLVEGSYEGVLLSERHYVPLKRDWSNLDETFDRLQDPKRLQEIVDCAYEEIYRSGRYSYRRFAEVMADRIESARGEHAPNQPRWAPIPINVGTPIVDTAEAWRQVGEAALERAQTNVGFAAARRYAGSPGVTTRLVRFVNRELGFQAFALLLSGLRSRDLGSRGLPADLIRLAVIAGARHRGGLVPYHVNVSLDDGSVIFCTVDRPGGVKPELVSAAIAEGGVRTVVWNHSHVSEDAVQLPIGFPLSVPLGSDGVWTFDALGAAISAGSASARAVLEHAVGATGDRVEPRPVPA